MEHARLLGRPAWAGFPRKDCFDVCAMALTWLFELSVNGSKGANSLAVARARFDIASYNENRPNWPHNFNENVDG